MVNVQGGVPGSGDENSMRSAVDHGFDAGGMTG